MPNLDFFVNTKELEYVADHDSLYNSLIVETHLEDVPSVSYLGLYNEGEILLPIEIFASDLAPLQAIVKYAKEIKKLSNSIISGLIGRDSRTIWLTYRAVKKKALILSDKSALLIPVSMFKDEKLSVLEVLVSFLRKNGLSYVAISRLLAKDQRTIWTVDSRAKKKMQEKNERQ
jgi:hypothetical protein